MTLSLMATFVLLPMHLTATVQAPPSTFDFWVGNWECKGKSRTAPGKDEWTDTTAKNVITKILGGAVVEENFSMTGFNGKSVTTYDKATKMWRQTWVDSGSSFLVFEGGQQGDQVILVRTNSLANRKQRMVFSDIKKSSFIWDWQGSSDDGKTWETMWTLNYKRSR